MNIFKALLLIPTLILQVKTLYDFVSQVDDDPQIKAAFDKFKSDPIVNMTWSSIKSQVDGIKNTAKQIQNIF